MPQRLSILDAGAVAALALLAVIVLDRQRDLDIEAPNAAAIVATTAPSCQDLLENRRFVIRRMMIADGSLALGNTWRNDALLGACPEN